jgi:hypothetical protein
MCMLFLSVYCWYNCLSITLSISQIYTLLALSSILKAHCCVFLKLKYRLLTVIDTADNSFSNPAQKIHELKSIKYLNYRVLTVENAIDKTESISVLTNILDL